MFAAHVADAVKSSGSRVGLTGVPTASRYYFISMLPLRGGFGARVDDRRDASAWKQGI